MSSKKTGNPSSSIVKCKHKSLSIEHKVDLLRKLDNGASVKRLCEEYSIGSSTLYDLKKQKSEFLKFYADSDTPKAISGRKTLHTSRINDVDRVLFEWFRQRRSEGVPISSLLLIQQAKKFHDDLKIKKASDYSQGWLHCFNLRHGTQKLSMSGEKLCANSDAARKFVEDFMKQDYFGGLPRRTLAAGDEDKAFGVKESKERLTVLACTNSAGTQS
jgi:hypothetical protein